MPGMRLVDTSELVAAVVVAHPHHAALPSRPPFRPDPVRDLIRSSLLPRLDPMPISLGDYDRAMDLVCANGLGSGAIYDALHVVGTERHRADGIVTLNHRHFQALAAQAQRPFRVINPMSS